MLHRCVTRLPAATLALVAAVSLVASSQTLPPADEVTLRIIVAGSPEEAARVRERVLAGEDFATVAGAVSLDPSAVRGGLLGTLTRSALRPELRDALAGVGAGGLTAVVAVPTGFAVLKVVAPAEAVTESPQLTGGALAALGAIKYVVDVSGFGVASVLLEAAVKPPGWNLDPRTMCDTRVQSLAAGQADLERDIATSATAPLSPYDAVQLQVVLGQLHAYHGRMEDAIAAFHRAYRRAEADVPSMIPELDEALGVAYLHKAELDNHLYHAPGDRCLLAPRGRVVLEKRGDIETAIAHFTRHLAARPGDLEVRWLLNVAHMAAGTYPDRVPEIQRIQPEVFESAEDVGRFVDIAPEAGLVSVAAAGGVIVDDFDGDGLFDVVTSSFDSCGPMRLFQRRPGGRFADRAGAAGLGGQVGGLNLVQADYDNDGHPDVLVLRGGWEVAQRKSLLRNTGNGTFTDVTVAAGLALPTSTQAAVWTDVDRDGFVDLFVGNEGAPAQLFLNRRDGTFEDVAAMAGVGASAFSKGVAAGDIDNDGWPDLYVSNLGGVNFLYRNNGDGTFTERARAAGVPGPGNGFATWFFDYDNDGWQDVFVASYFTSVDETARTYLGLPNNARPLALYRNLHDGRFEDVTRAVGLDRVFMTMGANYGDIDNDGFLDVYLGTGNPSYASLVPSVLLRNREGSSFADVTVSSGTGEMHKGHGVAFADLDHDGDEDILFEVGGATPGDAHALRLFENPGHGNDWLAIELVGVKANRGAIGARIAVTVESGGRRRTIHRTVGSGGSFGASPLRQHVGLGRNARIVDVEIRWPGGDGRQRLGAIEKNQFIEVTESAGGYRRLVRPPAPLRAGS